MERDYEEKGTTLVPEEASWQPESGAKDAATCGPSSGQTQR
jgi:hypothetical protein